MNAAIIYKFMSYFYDLLDVIYFRDYENSPRKAVLEAIDREDKVLDLCTGTATNTQFNNKCFDKILISLVLHELEETLAEKILKEATRVLKDDGRIIVTEWEPSDSLWRKMLFFPIHVLEPKTYRKFIKKDLYEYFRNYGLEVVKEMHCDYSKVLIIRSVNSEVVI